MKFNEEDFGSFAAKDNKERQSNDYQQEYEDDEEPVELYEVNLLDFTDTSALAKGNSPKHNDGINADEFEHIAEIYDQIRLLHQQFLFSERSNPNMKTQIDRSLASYFDEKLK